MKANNPRCSDSEQDKGTAKENLEKSPPQRGRDESPLRGEAGRVPKDSEQRNIAPLLEQYRSRHKAILVSPRSNIGSAAELYRWAHRAREGIEASSWRRSRHYSGRVHSSSRAYHKIPYRLRRGGGGQSPSKSRGSWQRPGVDAGELSESSYLCRQISNDYLC